MEHFFRHHQRKLIILKAVLIFLLAATLESAAFSADKSSSQASSSALDFANGLYARKMYGPAITEYEKFLKTYPDSPEAAAARFRYADSHYFSKDYAAAIAHFDVFLKRFPQDKRTDLAKFRLGTARFYQGDRARAIQSFVRLSRDSQEMLVRSGALFYLGKSLQDKGLEQRATSIYGKLIAADPKNEYASYAGVALGDMFIQSDRLTDALTGYLAAAQNTEPQELTRQARFKVAEIYFSQKQYDSAAAYYSKVYEEASADPLKDKSLLGLFYCDYHKQDLESASRRYKASKPALESSESRDEIMYLLANLYADQKKYDEAQTLLDQVIASNGVSDELREKARFKKIAVLSESGRKEDSIKELETYFSADKKSQDKALFEKAQLFSEIKKYDEALDAFQKVITGYPASEYAKNALYQSGVVLMKAGRSEESKGKFRDFAARYPADTNADLALLQVVQADLDLKKYDEAFQGAEAFIKAHPDSSKLDIAYYKLGVAATSLGRFGHAAFAFQKLDEKFPSSKLYVEALYGQGVSLENARKLPEAIAIYEAFLRDYPEHALSSELRPRLGYLYIQNNDPGKALTYYEDLLFNRKEVPLETDGVFWLVQYLLDQGLYDRLSKILQSFDDRFPGKNLTHEKLFFQGETAMGMKDPGTAAELYQKSIQADPEGVYVPQAHLGRGIALTVLGRDSEAETAYAEALKYDHELKVAMRARFELANLQLKAKHLEEAAKGFMMVAILYDDPKYTPPSLYKAGECFRAIGKKAESDEAFSELLSKYPDSDWAKKV